MDGEINLSLIKPSDLPHLAGFQLGFEGRLRDYQYSARLLLVGHVFKRGFHPLLELIK